MLSLYDTHCSLINMITDTCRPAKRVKEARTWSGGKVSKAEADDLNRSEPVNANGLTNGDAPVDVSNNYCWK